jgi:hypothetical protein
VPPVPAATRLARPTEHYAGCRLNAPRFEWFRTSAIFLGVPFSRKSAKSLSALLVSRRWGTTSRGRNTIGEDPATEYLFLLGVEPSGYRSRSLRGKVPPASNLFQRRRDPDGSKFYLGGKFFNLPPRMAGCAGKSFATPQSCLISIRLLPLGNEPEQMWTVSTRNLLDSLLWSGLPVKK